MILAYSFNTFNTTTSTELLEFSKVLNDLGLRGLSLLSCSTWNKITSMIGFYDVRGAPEGFFNDLSGNIGWVPTTKEARFQVCGLSLEKLF